MKKEYTTGPWKYNPDNSTIHSTVEFLDDYEEKDERVIPKTVVCTYGAMGGDNTMADINLIVHAPELLEALQGMVEQAKAQFKAGDKYATFNKNSIELIEQIITNATQKETV